MAFGLSAAAIGAIGAVGGAVIGGSIAARGARSAANTQAAATDRAVEAQNAQAAQTREDLTPYRETGYRALSRLEGEIDRQTTAADVMADPGYQFALQQGQQGLDRRFAASGGRISLATGDGANDIPMIAEATYGFAYRAKPKARAAANGRVDRGDLTAVLSLLGIPREDWREG